MLWLRPRNSNYLFEISENTQEKNGVGTDKNWSNEKEEDSIMCFSDGTLLLYLDGEMDKVAAEVVYNHLVVCDACSQKRDRLVEINETIQWFFEKQKLEKIAEKAQLGPTTDKPPIEQINKWLLDVTCEATDGCIVELDGKCPHGCPSWLVYLGLIS